MATHLANTGAIPTVTREEAPNVRHVRASEFPHGDGAATVGTVLGTVAHTGEVQSNLDDFGDKASGSSSTQSESQFDEEVTSAGHNSFDDLFGFGDEFEVELGLDFNWTNTISVRRRDLVSNFSSTGFVSPDDDDAISIWTDEDNLSDVHSPDSREQELYDRILPPRREGSSTYSVDPQLHSPLYDIIETLANDLSPAIHNKRATETPAPDNLVSENSRDHFVVCTECKQIKTCQTCIPPETPISAGVLGNRSSFSPSLARGAGTNAAGSVANVIPTQDQSKKEMEQNAERTPRGLNADPLANI